MTNTARESIPAPMTDEEIAVDVGARIHQLMWRQRISQAQLGAAIGVSQTTAGKKIRGKVALTALELAKAAQLLNVEPGDLFPKLPRLDSNQQPCVYTLPQVSAGVEVAGGRVVRLDDWREERRIRTAVEAVAR